MKQRNSVSVRVSVRAAALMLAVVLTTALLKAQSTSTQMGARAMAMGYASSTLGDEWSLFNNVGGVAALRSPSTAAAQEIQPALEGASRIALAMNAPLAGGVASVGVFQFGDSFYKEQIISTAYSNTRGIASLGIKASYVAYRPSGLKSRGAFAISFGGIATLTPKISVGAFITNLNQPVLEKITKQRLPLQMTAGISFRPTKQFLLTTEIQKDLAYNPVFRSGVEYEFHPQLFFRTGFNLHPNAGFLGVGLVKKKLKIDYAIALNTFFGTTHQISVIFNKNKPNISQ